MLDIDYIYYLIYIHKAPCLSVRLCVRPLRAKRAKLSPLQVLEFGAVAIGPEILINKWIFNWELIFGKK